MINRLIIISLFVFGTVLAEEQKSISSTLNIYVFPSDGQDSAQQSKDESDCYQWAVENSGVDPFELDKQAEESQQQVAQQEQQVQQSTQGAGARGAVGGAAAGAIIGEISHGDTSESAAYGAAAGALISRRRAKHAKQQVAAEADSASESIEKNTEEQRASFNKAFSVCLEAKDYLVKF